MKKRFLLALQDIIDSIKKLKHTLKGSNMTPSVLISKKYSRDEGPNHPLP